MVIANEILITFASIGLATSVAFLLWAIKNIIHYAKHKEFAPSSEQMKYELESSKSKWKIEQLKEKNTSLQKLNEKHNKEMSEIADKLIAGIPGRK